MCVCTMSIQYVLVARLLVPLCASAHVACSYIYQLYDKGTVNMINLFKKKINK